MAGGGETSVRVPINLEIVNSSLADIKKVLDSLSPNTKNFSALKGIVADMEKSAATFAQKMSVPFRNKSQFTSAGKDLDKFMAQMEKFNQLRGGLQLGDFKVVDSASLQQLADLKKQLEDAQKEITKIQEQTLQGLFNNADVSGVLIKIDPDITKKSFEEVETIVNEKVNEINDKIAKIGSENGKAIDIGNKLKDIVGKNFISADVLGEDVFNQFFKKNGAFKAGQQNPFVDYLTQTFALTPDQVNKLKDQSAAQINNILNDTFKNGNRRFFQTQQKRANAAEKGSADLLNSQEVLAALQQVQTAFNTAGAQSEQYRQALANLHSTMDKVTQSSQKQGQAALGTNYDAMAAAVQNYKASLESAQGSLMKLNRQQATFNSLKTAITNFMGFTQVLNLVRKGVTDAAAHIKELDTVMNGISIVTDMSTADLWGQVDAYTQLAQKYGTTIKGAYEVSQIYYQQGLKSNEVMSLTEETLKLSKISGLDYATTTDYMTTALRGFHMEMEDASRVVDVYSALAANTAVSQQELAEAMTRTASSMEAIGTTFEEASAMIATMVAATRESASNIGSAMKSIGSRYGELTKDPTKLMDSEGEEISFNKVDAALKSVGISMQTADHQFRSFTEVILELSDAWDTLDSRQQRYIATQMAGNRQQSRFLALVSNGDELRRNLEIAENSEGTGSEQALKYLDSLEAKLNQVQTAWQEFYTTIGIEEAWKGFLGSVTEILNTLNGLDKAFDKIPLVAIGAITTAVNTIKTIGLAALAGLAKTIRPYIQAAGAEATAEAGTQAQQAVTEYKTKFQALLSNHQKGINTFSTIASAAAGALSTISLVMDRSTDSARKNAKALADISGILQVISGFGQLATKNYGGAILSFATAITTFIQGKNLLDDSLEEKANRFQQSADELKNKAQQLKSDERSLTSLKKKYDELEEHRYDSEEAAQAFQEVQNEIAEKFPELVNAYDSAGNAAIEATTLEERLTAARLAAAQASTAAAEAEIQYQKAQAEVNRIKYKKQAQDYNEQNQKALKEKYGVELQRRGIAAESSWSDMIALGAENNSSGTIFEGVIPSGNPVYNLLDDEHWLAIALSSFLKSTGYKNESALNNMAKLEEEEDLKNLIKLYQDFRKQNADIITDAGSSGELLDQILEERESLKEYNQATDQLLSKSYDSENFNELYDNWKEEFARASKYMSTAQLELAGQIQTSIQSAQAGVTTSIETIKQLESVGVQSALNEIIYNKDNNITLLQDSSLYTVYSKKLLSGVSSRSEDQTISDYVNQYTNDIQLLDRWLNSLDAYEREQFEERLKDRRHYNTYDKLTKDLELGNLPTFSNGQTFEQFINDYYNPTEIQERAQQHIAAASGKAQKEYRYGVARTLNRLNEATFNTPAEEEFNNQLINLVNTIGEYNPNFDWDLSKIPAQFSKLSNELQDKLLDNGLLNPEAIEASMKALEDAGEGGSNIYAWLKEIKSELIDNLLLSIQTELDAYTKGADTAISNIKKLQSGVGFEDLSKILTTLNQYLDDTTGQLSIDDFDFVDGKWVIKLNSLEKVTTGYTKQMSEFDGNFEERMKAFDEARKLIEQINNGEAISDVSILGKAGIADVDKYLKLNKKGQREWANGNSSAELSKAINDNEKLATQQNELYKAYKDNYEANLLQLINDQKRIDKTLTSVINNRKDIQLTDVTKLSDQLGFKNIQAMIDKGFVSWVGNHYEATAEQLQNILDRAVKNGKLTDTTQINNFQAQIDKLVQESSPQAALSNIIASPDKVTDEMLVAYANALHVGLDFVKALVIKNADNKTYTVSGKLTDFIALTGMGSTDVAAEYANKLREAITSVYNSFVNAFTNDEVQYIANTAENREVLEALPEGIATFSDEYQKWIIDASNLSTEQIIKELEDSNLTQEQKTKNIDSVLKAEQSKNFDTVFSTILKDINNISRDTMKKLADNLGISVKELIDTDAFEFDSITDTYKVADKGQLSSILAGMSGKITDVAYRTLEAQIYTIENEFEGQAISFLSNTSIKETDVANILNKFSESLSDGTTIALYDFINDYFIRDLNGNLQIKDNASIKAIGELFDLSEDQILSALTTRIAKTISSLGNLANESVNGFDSIDKANAILQDVRASGYNTDFSYLFDYSESLHKFVYTSEGIALRVQQLREQMESGATAEEQQRISQQLDQFMVQMGESIDITQYRELEVGTKEWQKAQQELIQNINNYNAAAVAAGKATINIDLVNAAVEGNVTAIQELYEQLDKELSTDQLVSIYQSPVTAIQTAMDTLENEGVGSLIDGTTATILAMSGAIDFVSTEIEGKYKITEVHFDELAQSYSVMYDLLADSGKATTKQLNETILKMVNAQVGKNQAGIEMLEGAAGMTIEQFGNLLIESGVTLTKDFLTETDEWSEYVTLLGGNQLQINDFAGLAKRVGWDTTSEAYKTAYKSYVDSMMQQNNTMRESILEFGQNIEQAQIGDQINVADLGLADGDYLFGTIKDGILTVNEFMNTAVDTLLQLYGDYLNNYEKNNLQRIADGTVQKNAKYAAAKNLIDNWDHASYEMIEAFAKSVNKDVKDFQEKMFGEENADGTYKGATNERLGFAQAFLGAEATADLRRETENSVTEIISSVIDGAISSLDGDLKKITVTDENRAILEKIPEEFGYIDKATNEFIFERFYGTVDELINYINSVPNVSDSQKRQWIESVYQQQQQNTTSALLENLVNSAENLDIDTVLKAQDNALLKDVINYNEITKKWSTNIKDLYQILIQETAETLGIDDTVYNQLRAQVTTQYKQIQPDALARQLISSNNNITEDMISNFVENTNLTYEELQEYLEEEGDHYKLSPEKAYSLGTQAGLKQEEIFNLLASDIINNLNSLSSGIVQGFTDVNAIQEITKNINAHLEDGIPEQTIEDLFDFNKNLNAFTLTADGIKAYVEILNTQLEQITENGQQAPLIEGQIKQLQKQVKDSVNFDALFTTGRSTTSRTQDRDELRRQLQNVKAVDEDAGEVIDQYIGDLFAGGQKSVEAAENIYEKLGKTFTAEDANKFARINLSQVEAAREALDSNVGDYITKEAAALGEAAGYFTISDPDAEGFVQILKVNKDNLENALRQYYHALLANGEQDIDKLNGAILDIWEEQGNKVSGQNDLLSKASGMTFREFGEGLAAIGVTLTENMLQEYIDSDLIEQIEGTNQVRVENFDAFARHIGVTDRSSKQYQDMYSQFVDSEIERTTYIQESILSGVNDISNAKAGDKINLSKTIAQFDRATQLGLAQRLEAYGAQYKDGILTISSGTDIFGISEMLLQTASTLGKEVVDPGKIESAMLELQDAIQDAIKGFVDAITGGIKGGITNQGKSDLISFAEKYLGQEAALTDKDFIAASDGLKLTTDAAIKLYNALKNIEGVDISGVFDSLSESILNRDNIDNMDGILAQIKSLSEQIADADAKGTDAARAKADALREELALYQEIAAAGINNPENYNFMNKKLPDGMQGPLNYWQSTAQMFQTMAGSAKSGYMTVQDFYAITTEMEHLAQLSGEQMSFMGMTIGKGAHSAAEIIEAGMSNLSTTAGHAGEINLSGLASMGMNLSMSAEDMAAGVEKGIDSAADANIAMLDGLIGVLETIVAMQKLEDVTGDNNEIDIGDIFPEITVNGNADVKGIQKIDEKYQQWAQELENQFKTDEKLAEKFTQIKIGNKNLREIIADIADNDQQINLDEIGVTAKQFTEIMEAFRQLNASGGFDSLDDTAAIMKTLAKTGAEIEVEMGNQKVTLTKGKVLIATKNKKGEYEYSYTDENGQTHKTPDVDAAVKGQINADIAKDLRNFNEEAGNRSVITPVEGKERTYTINLTEGFQVEMTIDDDTSNYVVNGKQYATPKLAAQSVAESYAKEHADETDTISGMKFGEMQSWQLALRFNLVPTVQINSVEDIKNNSEVLGRILRSGKTANQILGMDSDQLKFAFGIELDENIREADLQGLLDEQKKQLIIAPEVAPINADNIKVEGLLHVKAIIDEIIQGGDITIKAGNGTKKTISTAEIEDLFDTANGGIFNREQDQDYYLQQWKTDERLRRFYTPQGKSIASQAGISEIIDLYNDYQLNPNQFEQVDAEWVKDLGEPLAKAAAKTIESVDFNQLAKDAQRQIDTEEKANLGSELKYDYQKSTWYKDNFKSGIVNSYLESLGTWQREELKTRLTEQTKGNEAQYSYMLATIARSWYDNLSKLNSDEQESPVNNFTTALSEATTAASKFASTLTGALSESLLSFIEKIKNSNELPEEPSPESEEGNSKKVPKEAEEARQTMYDAQHAGEEAQYNKDWNEYQAQQQALKEADEQQRIIELGEAYRQKVSEAEDAIYNFNNGEYPTLEQYQTVWDSLRELTSVYNDYVKAGGEDYDLAEQMGAFADIKNGRLAESFRQQLQQQFGEAANTLPSGIFSNLFSDYLQNGLKEEYWDNLQNWFEDYQSGMLDKIDTVTETVETVNETVESNNKEEPTPAPEKSPELSLTSQQQSFFSDWEAYINNPKLFNRNGTTKNAFTSAYNEAFDVKLDFDAALKAAKSQIESLTQEPATLNVEADTSEAANSINPLKNQTGTLTIYGKYIPPANMPESTSGVVGATGNVALAKGTRTLMGELGPELVVSNGQYFLAGQNGAEFVDLAKDAIVFNHIQTKRLLSTGSSGRGTPLTNERNATSMATGNVRGPAKASAEAVLGQLRAIRAMWESLRDASLSDLAKKGGGGGGGGNKEIPGFIRDVERWYNWLQKIADLEKQITYQEQLRSKIQSDMVSNGKAYYASQKQSYEDLRLSAITSESLYLSQRDYFEKRRAQLNSEESPLSQLYTFDESGQIHFKDKSYEWLANLFKTGDYGNIDKTPKQQYEEIIRMNPAFAQFMKYDDSGKQIKQEDYKGKEDEYYLAMVKAFSDRMDSEQEEMQELFDSWNDQQKAVLEQMQAMNEQLQAMKDNQKEVEESVLKAIEESRQRQIDEMKDTKEAIQKTNEDFIDGLSKSLEKERQLYEDTEKDQELERNRRQLAILKRSGASASQIAQLQEKVDQQARDQYFEKQQEQIDAVKDASDLQLEKMDLQIELAQEQLDYEKAHGLLWGQVYEVMAKTPQEIADFITSYTSEYWEKSPLSSAEDSADILFKAEQWSAFRDDVGMQEASLGMINQNLDIFLAAMKEIHGKDVKWDDIEKTAKTKYENLFSGNNDDPGITAWQAYQNATELATKPATFTGGGAGTTTGGGGSGSGGGRTGLESTWYHDKDKHWQRYWKDGKWSRYNEGAHNWKTISSSSQGMVDQCTVCKLRRTNSARGINFDTSAMNKTEENKSTTTPLKEPSSGTNTAIENASTKKAEPQFVFASNAEKTNNKTTNAASSLLNFITESALNAANSLARIFHFSSGGVDDYTGLAMLHGTPTEPEGILNAEDYKAWKQDIKTTNLLYDALASVSAVQRSAAAAIGSTTNNETGINIENAVVNMNTTIANDYDARRAGEQALEQMLTIARKSGTRSAQRR